MRRCSLPLLVSLLTTSFVGLAAGCTPKGDAPQEQNDILDFTDVESGRHALEWRSDSDELTTSPVSLTASDGTGLQLVSMDANAVLEDPLAFTELTMVFHNPEDRVREGRFEINLPAGAAISRFAMKIDGEWQEAEMVERQAARAAYEDFLHRRQDPALLEKKAGNQFRARVFPIPPSGTKEIKVAFSQELDHSKEPYRMLMQGLPRMESLDVDVAVVRKSTQAGLSSTLGGKASHVEHLTLHESRFSPRADLEVTVERTATRRGLRHDRFAVGRIAPVAAMPDAPIAGMTILFDTSASRALGFDGQVERLLDLIGGLAESRDFPLQIVAFDQQTSVLFHGSARDGQAQAAALAEVQPLGASDLASALSDLRDLPNLQPRLLLVSDGIVTAGDTDHAALREGVAALGGITRFDALVDGGIVDESSLRALTTALENDGIVANARLTRDTIVRKLTQATRSGIAVEVEGASFVWPKTLDGMQPGDEVIVYADLPKDAPFVVSLDDQGHKRRIAVPTRPSEGKLLERAFSQARVEGMTAELSSIEGTDESAQTARRELQKRIIDLSTQKRVLSDFTAMLVLETDQDYDRFGIDRTALADVLTVGAAGIEVLRRSSPSRDLEEQEPEVIELPPEPEMRKGVADASDEAGGSGQRHHGEEGRMGRPGSAVPQMARNFDPDMAARANGILGVMEQDAGHFMASPYGGSFAVGNDDEDVWGGLTGTEIGESFGVGGLGLSGTGRGGGGTGEGTIGLGNQGLIGSGGGGSGSGYGRGSGAGFGGRGQRAVPRVRQAAATVTGSLDKDIIRRIIRAHINEVRSCYNAGLQRDPELEGRVEIQFTIGAGGRVSKSSAAEVDDNGLDDRRVEQCISRAVKRWKFPKPQGGGTVSVLYPFLLSPADPPSTHVPDHRSRFQAEKPRDQDAWTGRFAQIMGYIEKGESALALQEAIHWRETEPASELALLGLGEAAEHNGEWVLAARAYGSLIDLFPSRADIRRMAGERLERVHERHEGSGIELAVDTYEKAVEQRPDHPASHRLYAYALLKAGRPDAALDAILVAVEREYPGGRFAGTAKILKEDAGLIAAAVLATQPKNPEALLERLKKASVEVSVAPTTRFVLNWETDANDVDFHIFDGKGDHASFRKMQLQSGGSLYADVTTGYGPECFTIEGQPRAFPYVLQGHYYSMGPMGYGMGKLQVVQHDGHGGLSFHEEPFVIMKDQAYVDLGRLEKPLAG